MLLRLGFILFLGLFYSNLTLGHSNIESRFLLAIQLGEYNKVKNFLNHKIDVNVKGFYEQTALHIAAMRGDNRIVSLLLEKVLISMQKIEIILGQSNMLKRLFINFGLLTTNLIARIS